MSDSKLKVGFVGVGLMGHGMAKNLVGNGFATTVWAHSNRKPIESLVQAGAVEAATLPELAAGSDVILLCVSNSDIVESVVFGEGGLLEGARQGTVFVDTGTSMPVLSREVNERLREAGMLYADAPLSRSPAKAEEGALVSFASCEAALMEKIAPVLEAYSEVVMHVGEEVGMAHELKLINNFISGAYVCAWSEAYNSCIAAGIDPKWLHQVVSAAGMNCLNFQNYSKFVLENTQEGHKFSIENLRKDIGYYKSFAQEKNLMTPLADPVLQLLNLAVGMGYGKDFAPVMPKVYGELNNTAAGDLPRASVTEK